MTSCLHCAHFLENGVNGATRRPGDMMRADKIGLCRRYPPKWITAQNSQEEGGLYAFPAVHQDHRCGEWSYWGPWEFDDDPDGPGGGESAIVTPLFPARSHAA